MPLLLSYITIPACLNSLRATCNVFGRFAKQAVSVTQSSVRTILRCIITFHNLFTHLETVHTMMNQVVFFMLVEKIICPEQCFSSLYSLLFFNILTYLRRALQVGLKKDRHWSQPLGTIYSRDFLHATARFVTLKLAKAVVLTMVLMLLTAHMKHYEPNLKYLIITGTYFINTTYDFEERFIALLKRLEFDLLEGMEEFWTPVGLKVLTCVYAVTVILLLFPHYIFLTLVASYTNLYVGYLDLTLRAIPQLYEEKDFLKKYTFVKKCQLEDQHIDSTCVICLDAMAWSRLTPCKHAFHGRCLRRWLKENNVCPMCKQNI